METQNHRPRADLPRDMAHIRTWGAALKACREKMKYKAIGALADALNLDAKDVNLWERNMAMPGPKEMRRLYAALPLLPRFQHLIPSSPPGTVIAVRRDTVALPPPPPPQLPPAEEPEEQHPAEPDAIEAEATVVADPPPPPPPVTSDHTAPIAFAEAMRILRAQLGLKQGPFAQPAGMSGADISRYERGGAMRQDMYKRLVSAYPSLGEPHITPPPGARRAAHPAHPALPKPSGNKALALQLAEAMDDYERAKVAYEAAMAEADGASKRQTAAKVKVDELLEQMRAAVR